MRLRRLAWRDSGQQRFTHRQGRDGAKQNVWEEQGEEDGHHLNHISSSCAAAHKAACKKAARQVMAGEFFGTVE